MTVDNSYHVPNNNCGKPHIHRVRPFHRNRSCSPRENGAGNSAWPPASHAAAVDVQEDHGNIMGKLLGIPWEYNQHLLGFLGVHPRGFGVYVPGSSYIKLHGIHGRWSSNSGPHIWGRRAWQNESIGGTQWLRLQVWAARNLISCGW